MGSYLVLKDKAQRFEQDHEIQAIFAKSKWRRWSGRAIAMLVAEERTVLASYGFDLSAMSDHPFGYQRLDQLTFELLTGSLGGAATLEQDTSRSRRTGATQALEGLRSADGKSGNYRIPEPGARD